MKRIVTIIFVVATVVFGYLYIAEMNRGKDQQEKTTGVEEELQKKMSDIKEYNSIISKLEKEKLTASRAAEDLKAKIAELEEEISKLEEKPVPVAEAESYASEEMLPDETEPEAAEDEKAPFGKKFKNMLSQMMDSPEMKKMIREQQKVQLDMAYGDLYEELWLNEDDTKTLKELLTDKAMNDMERALLKMGVDTDETQEHEREEELNQEKEEITAKIEEFLGDEGFAHYEEYNKTLQDRLALHQFRERLAGTDTAPLDDDQEYDFLTVIREERENKPFTVNFEDPNMSDPKIFSKENIDTWVKQKEDLDRRVLERSRDILTSEQFEEYETFLDTQLKMMKLSFSMAAKMFAPEDEKPEEAEEGEESEEEVEGTAENED